MLAVEVGALPGIIGATYACRSLDELGAIGTRLYGLALTHEQAVAFSSRRC